MKQLEQFFSIETEYDKKHKLNTCNKQVPLEYLTSIENGCSIEQLEEMMRKKFDFFKDKTQITIHGIFPELSTNRVGWYVNLTQNKNKSIGVRYTAIDHNKKKRLFEFLSKVSEWRVQENSTLYCIGKMQVLPNDWEKNRDKVLEIVRKYEAEAKKIDKNLFVGNVSCYVAQGLFHNYMCLDVNICCFYEKNFEKLFENLSGMTLEDGKKKYAAIKAEEKRKNDELDAKWRKEAEERKLREEEERKEAEERINKLISENPAPESYFKRENYQPQVGDNICRLYFDKYSKTYKWVELTCKKYFGKLKEKPVDKDFDNYWCKPISTNWVYVKTV
mgnify:FL=1